MNKKQPQKDTLEQELSQSPSFTDIESRIYKQVGNDVYIGKDKINEAMRSALRDDAKMIEASRLWEILNASALNEAYDIALIRSLDFDQVRFAKALKHWIHFMRNVIYNLTK